jgi:deoxycytidine triphosphate deaminase
VSVVSGKEVAACCSSFVKINPNGVDLAPTQVSQLPRGLTILLHGDKRGYLGPGGTLVTEKARVHHDAEGYYNFEQGTMYELRFPEITVPETCTGFAFPRSSVNRLGIIKLESAVFDSGYHGEPTQVIFTPIPARVHSTEALVQLVFIRNEKAAESLYSGFYQHEKGG